jgi:predicted phage baseplate assembly protein
VDNRLWKRVPSLFARGPKEEIYIVREDAQGASWVQFGDGKTGARLPSGKKNVVAMYRSGIGAFGPLKEGTNANPVGRVDRLQKIKLPGVVSGGEQPESGGKARQAAPGKVQSLDRLVSLADFESETLAIAGVARASATWSLVDNVPAVVITVLMRTGREAEITNVRQILAGYNRCRGPRRFPIIVHQGHVRYIFLDASMSLDPRLREELVLADIKRALGVVGDEGNGIITTHGLLSIDRRRFGEKEYETRIEAAIQNVTGVLWAKVKGLGSLSAGDDPLLLIPPVAPWPYSALVGCAADSILALHKNHLILQPVAAPTVECAL